MMSRRFVDSFLKLLFDTSSPSSDEPVVTKRKKGSRRGRRHQTAHGVRDRSIQYADSFIFVPPPLNDADNGTRGRAQTTCATDFLSSSNNNRQSTPRLSAISLKAPKVEDVSSVNSLNAFQEPLYQRISGGSVVSRPLSCHSLGRNIEYASDCIRPSSRYCYSQESIDSDDDDYAQVKDPDKLLKVLGRPLSPHDIALTERIGEGQFGDVHKGILYPDTTEEAGVAVKTCKPDAAPEERAKFLQEAAIMKQFSHPHIIKLFGVVTQGMTTYIVMELAPLGQLRQYLLLHGDTISRDVLLCYIRQLCSAMVHLESKNYVHRDIAARNILLLAPDKIKLSDFGLSRWLEEADFYVASRGKLPIKWMAPESINFRRFTGASDVWMFGVCSWEILMRGVKPFIGIKNDEVIGKLEQGERLPLPPDCPPSLFNLMNKCWQYEPGERPSFADIETQLSVILEQERHFMNIASVGGQRMMRGYEIPDHRHVPLHKVPSTGSRKSLTFDDNEPLPPALPPRSIMNNRPLPPEPTTATRKHNGSDSTVDPYLITTLPGARGTPDTLVSPQDTTGKSFSPIPPPPIIRQQQKERSQPPEEERPPSELFYDSVPAEVILSPPPPAATSREASPYEQVNNNNNELDDDDPVMEEMLSYTTAVVKAVMELSSKLNDAKPNDYVDLVKGVGVALRELLGKVDGCMDSLPHHTHQKVRMAHKVLSSDMQQLVKSMKELQDNYQSFLLDHYQKQMLQSATIIAVNSKHLLEAFNSAAKER